MMKRVWLIFLVVVLSHEVSKAAECNSRGRYPNNDETDCRGYTMCLPMGGTFMQYKLACPLGSVYSHLEQQCTTTPAYQCLPSYTCNGTGNFEDSMDENCGSYIACVHGLVDLVTPRRINCPVYQVFSFGDGGCVNETEYICHPIVKTTTMFEVTEVNTVANGNVNVFEMPREIPSSSSRLSAGRNVHSKAFIIVLVCCLIKNI